MTLPARTRLMALSLSLTLLATPFAQAINPLGWLLLNQALNRAAAPSEGPPSVERRAVMFAQTTRAADSLNQILPIDVGDGLAATLASAAAPGDLELEFRVLSGAPPTLSPTEVDQRWGGSIRSQICQSPFFKAWLSQGGELRLVVRSRDGSLARQYFANETDCPS